MLGAERSIANRNAVILDKSQKGKKLSWIFLSSPPPPNDWNDVYLQTKGKFLEQKIMCIACVLLYQSQEIYTMSHISKL